MSAARRSPQHPRKFLGVSVTALALVIAGTTLSTASASGASEPADFTVTLTGSSVLLTAEGEELASATSRTPGSMVFDTVTTPELGDALFVATAPNALAVKATSARTAGTAASRASSASTEATSSETEEADLQLTYLTSQKGVVVAWTRVPDAISNYTVYRDGVVLTTTPGTSFTDTTGAPGKQYTYEVSVEQTYPALTPSGTEAPETKTVLPGDEAEPAQTGVLDPSVGDPETPTSTGITMGVQAARLTDAQTVMGYEGAVASSTAATTRTYLRYTTFITEAKVSGKALVCGSPPYFDGNNRSFSPTSSAYKTRVTLTYDWPNGKVHADKSVHDTIRLDSNGRAVERRNAGTSGIKVTVSSQGTQQTKLTVNHSVGNPFCKTSAIAYNLRATVKRSGGYVISGEHRRAPYHEMYLGKVGSSGIAWTALYQFRGSNFNCLQAGLCTYALFDRSKS